jgi:molybdopterin converting factor subunit 1
MRILFFAQLKDVTGCAEISLAPATPLTADAVWAELLERFPGLSVHRSQVRLARNWEYTAPGTLYQAGDEIALVPPVSGG